MGDINDKSSISESCIAKERYCLFNMKKIFNMVEQSPGIKRCLNVLLNLNFLLNDQNMSNLRMLSLCVISEKKHKNHVQII